MSVADKVLGLIFGAAISGLLDSGLTESDIKTALDLAIKAYRETKETLS